MQDATIINNFKRLEKHINDYIKANQQNVQQAYNILGGVTITLDAFINAMVERGIITGSEMREAIEREKQKREMAAKQQQANALAQQPQIDSEANVGPTVEDMMDKEEGAGE